MLQINLTPWERLNLFILISNQKGTVDKIAKLLRIREALEFSDDERDKIELTQVPVGDGGITYQWNESVDEYTIEMRHEDARLMKEIALKHDQWAVLPETVALHEKLKELETD